jgi:hypothetical protein
MNFLTVKTSRTSAPFRVGYLRRRAAALSGRLQTGLRFFRPLIPPTPSPFLAVGIPPCGGAHGVCPVGDREDADWRGWNLYPGGSHGCRCNEDERCRPTHVPFGSRRLSLLSPSRLHEVLMVLRSRSTFQSFPGPWPVRGYQRSERCPRSFGRRITPPPVRVGTPGHHRARVSWCGHLLCDTSLRPLSGSGACAGASPAGRNAMNGGASAARHGETLSAR